MGLSLVSQIMAVAELRLMLTAGAEGVYRPLRSQNGPCRHGAIWLTHDDVEHDEELSAPGMPPKIAWVLPLRVSCIVMPDLTDESTPIDSIADDFVGEAMNAITDNVADWHKFDDLAINSVLGSPQSFHPGDDTAHGIQFMVRVTYRVDENDQFSISG